jgi:hypothetical protein
MAASCRDRSENLLPSSKDFRCGLEKWSSRFVHTEEIASSNLAPATNFMYIVYKTTHTQSQRYYIGVHRVIQNDTQYRSNIRWVDKR